MLDAEEISNSILEEWRETDISKVTKLIEYQVQTIVRKIIEAIRHELHTKE